ncbi:hypothetical protein EVA_06115 [gut metagenome]|uniref:Uncharacterized protein n=1 Tax=gut metagenome TaxID=749906 RepID=J9GSW1_9ZZZZ
MQRLVNLACQFAGRRNHQAVNGIGRVRIAGKHRQQRQQVGCSLSRTRLCHSEHIAVFQNRRDTLSLDRRAFFKTHIIKRIQDIVREFEIFKVGISHGERVK